MPIVSHILEQTQQPNGATSNVLKMYDQDAREYVQGFWAPAGFDVQTKVQNSIAEMDEQLKRSEFETLVGAA